MITLSEIVRAPAVAFAHPGVEEVVEDGRTGFVVPEGDVEGLAARSRVLLEDSALAQRLGTARLGSIALAWSAIAMLVLRALRVVHAGAVPFVLYVVIEAASGVLVIQVWAVASAATDARTARRLLPVAGLGASVAWTISGLAVQPAVGVVGAEGLLIAAPILLGGAWVVAGAMARLDPCRRGPASCRSPGSATPPRRRLPMPRSC